MNRVLCPTVATVAAIIAVGFFADKIQEGSTRPKLRFHGRRPRQPPARRGFLHMVCPDISDGIPRQSARISSRWDDDAGELSPDRVTGQSSREVGEAPGPDGRGDSGAGLAGQPGRRVYDLAVKPSGAMMKRG